ncbi:hypothetical protein Gyru_ORF104 [Gynaephora ruoergensis nucleopolyhedrovirus]|nr:hypothetical protein Gyru_ORF104 [Gynaephora ruoergensis nucleopolyhedrovirus]
MAPLLTNRNSSGGTNVANVETVASFVDVLRSIDFSQGNGKRFFYNLCYRFVCIALSKSPSVPLITLKTAFDTIVEIERFVFAKSRLLHYIVAFLIAHSDGDNLQCLINLRLLDYFLNNYQIH